MFIFEAHWNAVQPSSPSTPGQTSWPRIRLQSSDEWFVVDVHDDSSDTEKTLTKSKTLLFPGLSELEDFAASRPPCTGIIIAVSIVTPGYRNYSEGWKIDQLAAVWDAPEPWLPQLAQIYETVDGRFLVSSCIGTALDRLVERTLRLRFKPSRDQSSEPHPTGDQSSQS